MYESLGGQVGDQAWKFSRHCVKAGRIGDPTGRNVQLWLVWLACEKQNNLKSQPGLEINGNPLTNG